MRGAVQSDVSRRVSRLKMGDRVPVYEPFDFALVRAPLLPFSIYVTLGENGTDIPPQFDGLVRRGLLIGARELAHELRRSSHAPRPSARRKLLRYLIRMSTRPTPFGAFAGVGLARWGARTTLELSTTAGRTRTRPDMEWLLRLVATLESRREIRRYLSLVANPYATIRGDRVLLPERLPRGEHSSPIVSLRATGLVRRVLALAREPIAYDELMRHLEEAAPAAEPARIEALVTELWEQTLLITDLWPPLTTDSPAAYVVDRLADIPAAQAVRSQLMALMDSMAAWDSLPPDDAAEAFDGLVDRARALFGGSSSLPVMVDTALDLKANEIHVDVGNEIARAAELLIRLTPAPNGPSYLAGYRQAFESRYGHAREVPLLELLDPVFGLGPPWSFHGGAGVSPEKAGQRGRILLELAIDALRQRRRVVHLDPAALGQLESWSGTQDTLPASIDLYAFIVAESRACLDRGQFQVVVGPNLGTDAAGRNLGRFADLLGADARRAIQCIAEAEQDGRTAQIDAELVYLPRSFHAANVVVRPAAREHELVLGATPGVPQARTIPVQDLVVGTRGGRFYVRWPAAEVDVIASAGHMLNTMNAPAVVRFLTEVRRDGMAQLSGFDWGPAAGFPVLPRVQVGRVVLRPAEWRIDARLREMELPADDACAFAARLAAWRERWDVPRFVALSAGDNRLLLDLDDPSQRDELRTELRKIHPSSAITLQEVLPDLNAAWLPGPSGHHVVELVVSVKLRESSRAPSAVRTPALANSTSMRTRIRPPGSEWLFVKLYCPPMFEDDLLAGPVLDLTDEAISTGEADEWFFVRYSDPDPNLRLRFRGVPDMLMQRLLPRLCTWAAGLVDSGHCLRFSFETYDRELERYGGDAGLRAAESIFAADSRAVVHLLKLLMARTSRVDRALLAVLTIDELLAGLGLGPQDRVAWYRERIPRPVPAGEEYRRRKTELRAILSNGGAGQEVGAILAERRQGLAHAATCLASLAAAGDLRQPMSILYNSYVHLHCNRLLGIDSGAERTALALALRTRASLDVLGEPSSR
jgi:lantibiotic biosynthesis protein